MHSREQLPTRADPDRRAHTRVWAFCLFVAALGVRLHWNLVVHPLGEYVYSDMRGYVTRADQALSDPWGTHEYAAFFPYGNHYLVAFVELLFGKDDYAALGAVYAVIGAALVAATYAIARRASAVPWVPEAVGMFMVFYYPLISLGGYVLSEVPFSLAMVASTLALLRLHETGRARDAVLLGVAFAVGLVIRPQLALSGAVFGLIWLCSRRSFPRITLGRLALAAIPCVVLLTYSAVRLHHHTGRYGLVSENGSFNLAFGRCHATKIEATPDGKRHLKSVHFRPPPFLQLQNHLKKHPDALRRLDPALGDVISYPGYIGDSRAHMAWVRRCLHKTGWLGQLDYSVTHLFLLWHYNIPWPDSGRPQWRPVARWWQEKHTRFLALPALLGLLFAFVPRVRPGMAVVSANLWAVLLVAFVIFGDARYRCPYDPFIVILAAEVVGLALAWSWRRASPRVRSVLARIRGA